MPFALSKYSINPLWWVLKLDHTSQKILFSSQYSFSKVTKWIIRFLTSSVSRGVNIRSTYYFFILPSNGYLSKIMYSYPFSKILFFNTYWWFILQNLVNTSYEITKSFMNHVYLIDNLLLKQAVRKWIIMLIFKLDLESTITMPFYFMLIHHLYF